MPTDPWDDPRAKDWVRNVLDNMLPNLAKSAVTVSLIPESREGDVKFWVELGASIMLDKPIIAVLLGDAPIPHKLSLVVDEIVRAPNGVDPASSEALAAAIERVVGDK